MSSDSRFSEKITLKVAISGDTVGNSSFEMSLSFNERNLCAHKLRSLKDNDISKELFPTVSPLIATLRVIFSENRESEDTHKNRFFFYFAKTYLRVNLFKEK